MQKTPTRSVLVSPSAIELCVYLILACFLIACRYLPIALVDRAPKNHEQPLNMKTPDSTLILGKLLDVRLKFFYKSSRLGKLLEMPLGQ
jgi:hypothetical protein